MITNPKGSVFKSISNQQPADELQKPIIKKFKEGRVYSSFKDNILGVNLADMQLMSKYNKGITFLICMIDILSKYAWAVSLKKKNNVLLLLMHFKVFETVQKENEKTFGFIKVVNFIKKILKNG